MSSNIDFDAIVQGLDIADTVTCEGCDGTATIRVSYACGADSDLMCSDCFDQYCAYLLSSIVKGLLTGHVLGHTCGAPLRTPVDISQHLHPENLDGSPLQ